MAITYPIEDLMPIIMFWLFSCLELLRLEDFTIIVLYFAIFRQNVRSTRNTDSSV